MKKLFTLALSLILIITMIPVGAAAEGDIEARIVVANCPSCGAATYVNYGTVQNVWYDDPMPTHCELDNNPQWIGHQHKYTEAYTLCRCTSCGYQLKSGYTCNECCEVLDHNYKLY